jgi:hypothetical protein
MKNSVYYKLSILGLVLIGISLTSTNCRSDISETHTPITFGEMETPSPGEEAADDFIPTPGGGSYRANVYEAGVENPWPPIESTSTTLNSGDNAIDVQYRGYIETKAGETRNNIIIITREGSPFLDSRLDLYSVDVPAGIELTYSGGAGPPGSLGAMLMIKISPSVAPDRYQLEIGLEINDIDYGTVTCTIKVVEE